jgi:hypothetical protein
MNSLRRAFCTLSLVVFLFAPTAAATSFSTDQSDLYYIAAESGWGMQLVQRGSVIFATLFVYGTNNLPTWYTATMDATGTLGVWSGDLYATTGPWFGTVPFAPANVVLTKVGTMTWTNQTVDTGNVTYTVNGLIVSKNVVRQTLVLDDYSGTYLAAVHTGITDCTNPGDDLAPTDFPLLFTITVTQSGSSMTVTMSALGLSQTISGVLSQSGQFGTVLGTYTDSTGDAGNASIAKLVVQENALTGSFTQNSTNDACHVVGYFAGMRSQH